MTVIVQPGTDSNRNPQPMAYDSDTGKVIVDSNGYVLNGGQRLVNIPSKADYVSTPKTQTSGIQEAINYVFNNGGGKIVINDGFYDITDAPFKNVGYNNYAQLTLPQNTNTSPVVNIAIVGNNASRGGIEGGEPLDSFLGGVTIYSGQNPTDTSNSYSLFQVGTSPGTINVTNINLYMDGIHFQTVAGSSMNAFNGYFLQSLELGSIYIDTNSTTEIPPDPNATFKPAGFTFPGGNSSAITNVTILGVVNYYYGIVMPTAHVSAQKIMVDFCVTGILLESENYGAHIGVYDVQNTAIHITNVPSSGIPCKLQVGLIDCGDQQTSGVYAYQYSIQDNATSTDTAGMNIVAALTSYQVTPAFSITQYSKIDTKFLYLKPTTSTPSVPASATAQENTNPYPVDVYLYGGTVTEIQITKGGTAYTVFSNSTGLALSGQAYKLNPGDSITVTYTAAPSWEWLSD